MLASWVERLKSAFGSGWQAPPSEDDVREVIAAVRSARLTYCGVPKMENMARAACRVMEERVPGDFLEAGVALGGSAIVLGRIKGRRPLDLYDVYAMIPPPGDSDGEDAHKRYADIAAGTSQGLGGDTYYGYVHDLKRHVEANLRAFGLSPGEHRIRLVEGLFQDTLFPRGKVAFAHIDCDWYDSVTTCIDRILPKLSPGGVIAFDDYSSYSGCRRAVDELLASRPDLEVIYQERSIGLRRRPT